MAALPGAAPRPGLFGADSLSELPRLAAELGMTRILLVTGQASFAASGAAAVLPALRQVATVETWSDFSPNPRVEDLTAGSALLGSFQPDGIVAIGGGSVLDMAKLLSVLGDVAADDRTQMEAAIRANAVAARSRPLVLVPTTSGSGSEATHFAVVYIGEEKFSVAGSAVLPDRVVLDPTLTLSASSYQKATSVIDAVAQAVESRWARGATADSRAFADDALRDLVAAAPAFVAGDVDAAVPAARGSYLAGRAIDLSKTTGAHALAYGLTKRHGVSHGHAVATTLGAWARLHAAHVADPAAHARLGDDLAALSDIVGADGPDALGDWLDAFANSLGLEVKLEALGVPHDDVAVMAGQVNHERLGNNPVGLDQAGVGSLLVSCW